MFIQDQIDPFLQIPEIKEIFSDHDIHWRVREYSQGWYFDFSVPDYEKGFFLGAWNAWQAAKAQAVLDQVLDAPACVGGGTFQKGVKWSTVIGAAQRHHENDGHHEAPAICIRDQLRVASGHSVVVPKEPTYEMLEAGSEARSRTEGHIASIWEAMIETQEQNQ
jgi:hypothetical protein